MYTTGLPTIDICVYTTGLPTIDICVYTTGLPIIDICVHYRVTYNRYMCTLQGYLQ